MVQIAQWKAQFCWSSLCRLPSSLFGHILQSALAINLTVPDFFLLMSPKPEACDSRPSRKHKLTFCITEGTGTISLFTICGRALCRIQTATKSNFRLSRRSCAKSNLHEVMYGFYGYETVHRDTFLILKPTRCTKFSNLSMKWHSTFFRQFLCPSSGVLHCTHTNGLCHTGLLTVCCSQWLPVIIHT
jgi:hypothetical protein